MVQKKIGLALSGGGARGFAHIGVLKVLEENGIRVDLIAGTSAGSIVGAAYAAGLSAAEVEAVGRKIRWSNMTRFSYSPRAVFSNAVMGKFIRRHFPAERFEDLKIPFAAVACDLIGGEAVVLKDSGDLIFAIRASCAVPGVFAPLRDDEGRLLVDGGVVEPIPTKTLKEMGADVVIAVDLLAAGATFRSVPRTMLGMFLQSAMTMLRVASRNQHYHADVVIIPEIAHLRPDEISKREEFIELGGQAARARIEEIKMLVG